VWINLKWITISSELIEVRRWFIGCVCRSYKCVCVCVWLKVVLFVLLFAFIEKPTREIEGRPSLFVFFSYFS
jgi:hypothetical protein